MTTPVIEEARVAALALAKRAQQAPAVELTNMASSDRREASVATPALLQSQGGELVVAPTPF